MAQAVSGRHQALIVSSHINAYSIALSLRVIGWKQRIAMVRSPETPATLGLYLRDLVDMVRLDPNREDLLDQFAALLADYDETWIFLTSEQYHTFFEVHRDHPVFRNCHLLLGPDTDVDRVLDRVHFYDHLASIGITAYPATVPASADPFEAFGDDFFLRLRASWKGTSKLPVGRPVHGRDDFERQSRDLLAAGAEWDDFCFQELLSIREQDNVSICGWHDPEYRHYLATRKVLQTPPLAGNGDVCEVLDPPDGLFEKTRVILDSFNYHGPFELEFIYQEDRGEYIVIELNPRFWMQNGLVNFNADHVLVRRYLGEDARRDTSGRYRFWVRPDRVIQRMLRGDRKALLGCGRRRLYLPTLARSIMVMLQKTAGLIRSPKMQR